MRRKVTLSLFFLSLFLSPLYAAEEKRTAKAPSGVWALTKAKELFKNPVYLRFYVHSKELRAQEFVKTSGPNPPLDKRPVIWNLRKKNGEYLYGWLRAKEKNKIYRCKLWQRQNKLFLRVYTRPIYRTYKLEAVSTTLL